MVHSTTDHATPNPPIAVPTDLNLGFYIRIGDTPNLEFSTGCVSHDVAVCQETALLVLPSDNCLKQDGTKS